MDWQGPIKPTYIDLPVDLRHQLKAEAARRGKTIRVAVQEALEAWLQPECEKASDPDVERLLEFKKIGPEVGQQSRVAALRENIAVFWEAARYALAARKRKGT